MARGMGQIQKTIKAILDKEFALRQPEPASIAPTGAKMLGSFLASAALAIVLDAIWCYFAVSGLVHMGSARAILVFAWIIGTVGIIVSDWIWGKPFVHRIRLGVFASLILAIMLIGLDSWTVRHRPSEVHPLTWADFPASLANRIADTVYNRIAPLFQKQASPPPSSVTASVPTLPITGSDRLSVLVPFVGKYVNAPIPLNENLQDPHNEFYSRLQTLSLRPNDPTSGWPPHRARNFEDQDESFKFVIRLVQFYLVEAIDTIRRGRQGIKWTAGVGVVSINKNPVTFPQSEPYPFSKLKTLMSSNEFFVPEVKMLWEIKPMRFPRGTSIVLTEQSMAGKPFKAFLRLERPDYFTVVFTVDSVGALNNQLPAGFIGNIQESKATYNITINMDYTIQHRTDAGFRPEQYAAWANALSAGLKDATGFN